MRVQIRVSLQGTNFLLSIQVANFLQSIRNAELSK